MPGQLETHFIPPAQTTRPARRPPTVSNSSAILNLPLQTLGLSAPVLDWLSDAGLPTLPVDRMRIRRGDSLGRNQRAILLYDSRDASARLDADAAASLGYEVIDVAQLISARTMHFGSSPIESDLSGAAFAAPQQRLLVGLRNALEDVGAVWVRIADYPHPYRAVVCTDMNHIGVRHRLNDSLSERLARVFQPVPLSGAKSGRVLLSDWLKTFQQAGQPVRTSQTRAAFMKQVDLHPLTWVTTFDMFIDWWMYRAAVQLHVLRTNQTTDVELRTLKEVEAMAPWRAALEMWRGDHCAFLPLTPSKKISLLDDYLPFQRHSKRFSAGFPTESFASSWKEQGIPMTEASSM